MPSRQRPAGASQTGIAPASPDTLFPLTPFAADRFDALTRWVHAQFPGREPTFAPASADASFRRYFRASFHDGKLPHIAPHIVMDAPPMQEDCRPFIRVAALFGAAGVNVPAVIAQDLSQGFLLLSDMGDTTYLAALNANATRADQLYRDALGALIRIQSASRPGALPPYDRALLLREMQLLPEWYIAKHKNFALDDTQQNTVAQAFEILLANNLAQPQVFVHRDYHSRNLMVWSHENADPADPADNPGILDFQDAVYGPITYDLASLLKDAYIEWEEERVLDWAIRYWEAAKKSGLPVAHQFDDFYRDFEWIGLQRHLKVLGIFARLYHRDGKDGYLKDLPLVLRYTTKVCARYGVFAPLLRLLHVIENVKPQAGYTF